MHYCLAERTLDDLMWSIAERKLEVTSSTISGERRDLAAGAGTAGAFAYAQRTGNAERPNDGGGDIRGFLTAGASRDLPPHAAGQEDAGPAWTLGGGQARKPPADACQANPKRQKGLQEIRSFFHNA